MTRLTAAAALVAALAAASAAAQPTVLASRVEFENGTVDVVAVPPSSDRNLMRFATADGRLSPLRIGANGTLAFDYGATIAWSPFAFSVTAGPQIGYVYTFIGGAPALIPVFAAPGTP